MVRSPLRTRDMHLPTVITNVERENHIRAARRDYRVLRRVAKDQKQYRAIHRREVPAECRKGQGGL